MTTSLNYNKFLQTAKLVDNIDCIKKMAYISQMRRGGYSVSKLSVGAVVSTDFSPKFFKNSVLSAIFLDDAICQKGFKARQYDSNEEFNLILESGFQSNIGEGILTLKLTLTPDLLRC